MNGINWITVTETILFNLLVHLKSTDFLDCTLSATSAVSPAWKFFGDFIATDSWRAVFGISKSCTRNPDNNHYICQWITVKKWFLRDRALTETFYT